MKRQKIISLRDGAVVLLGAGFSRSVGLPLMGDLLRRSVPEEMIEIVRYMGGFGPGREVTIEDFLTLCDFEDAMYLGRAKNYSYLPSFAADIAISMFKMSPSPQFWKSVVDLVEICSTIINLNWDTLLEIQVRALDRSIVYKGRSTKRAVKVLKPHGSIDWYKKSCVGPLASHAFFVPLFRGYLRYYPFTEEQNLFAVPQEFVDMFNKVPPEIIAPTHIKAVPTGPFREIWLQMYRALECASDVVVIGYSMPPSDFLIKLMLQRSIRYQQILGFDDAPRLTVIDPDPTGMVEERFTEVFGTDFRLIRRTFLETKFIKD